MLECLTVELLRNICDCHNEGLFSTSCDNWYVPQQNSVHKNFRNTLSFCCTLAKQRLMINFSKINSTPFHRCYLLARFSVHKVLTRSKLNCKIAFDAMLNSCCCIALSHLKCLGLRVKINAFYSYCFLLIGIATCHKPHDFAPLFEKVHQSLYRENPQK